MFLLSANAGSSSLKLSLFKSDLTVVHSASYSALKTDDVTCKFDGSNQQIDSNLIVDHKAAFHHFLNELLNREEKSEISHVCHRIVHGGEYENPIGIHRDEFHHIQALSNLAPLHNARALDVIQATHDGLRSAKSVAFFDTTFHSTIPKHVYTYPIHQQSQLRLRKYGFHGLSYSYILRSTAEFLSVNPTDLNAIFLHLGAGSSICAVRQGRSLDTTMGLTPLSGLPGATRSGDVDPALVFHYKPNDSESMGKQLGSNRDSESGLGVTQAESILNKQAGWKAIAGTTDFGQITQRAFDDDKSDSDSDSARLAFAVLVDRILNAVGAYHVKLSSKPICFSQEDKDVRTGVDAIVFAGGLGEADVQLRTAVSEALAQSLGYPSLDSSRNEHVSDSKDPVIQISESNSKTKILVVHTDEQTEMAKQCLERKEFWDQ